MSQDTKNTDLLISSINIGLHNKDIDLNKTRSIDNETEINKLKGRINSSDANMALLDNRLTIIESMALGNSGNNALLSQLVTICNTNVADITQLKADVLKNSQDINVNALDIVGLKKEIDDLKIKDPTVTINNINSNLNTLDSAIKTNKLDISNLKTDIANNATEIKTNKTEIANLKTLIGTLTGTSGTNFSQIQVNKDDITDLKALLQKVQTQANTNTSDIGIITNNIENLRNDIKDNVKNIYNDIDELTGKTQGAFNHLQSSIDTVQTDIKNNVINLQTQINANKTNVSNVTNTITTNAHDIRQNTQDIAVLKNKVSIHESSLKVLDTDVANTARKLVPVGTIVAYYGSERNVPSDWAVCDGTRGTPDLRDRFIVGAGKSYALHATGGEAYHTLNTNEMPAHAHEFPGDDHLSYAFGIPRKYNAGNWDWQSSGDDGGASGWYDTRTTGGNQGHENRPPYYALFYIMKISN